MPPIRRPRGRDRHVDRCSYPLNPRQPVSPPVARGLTTTLTVARSPTPQIRQPAQRVCTMQPPRPEPFINNGPAPARLPIVRQLVVTRRRGHELTLPCRSRHGTNGGYAIWPIARTA